MSKSKGVWLSEWLSDLLSCLWTAKKSWRQWIRKRSSEFHLSPPPPSQPLFVQVIFHNLRQIHFTIWDKYISQFETNIFQNLRQISFLLIWNKYISNLETNTFHLSPPSSFSTFVCRSHASQVTTSLIKHNLISVCLLFHWSTSS